MKIKSIYLLGELFLLPDFDLDLLRTDLSPGLADLRDI